MTSLESPVFEIERITARAAALGLKVERLEDSNIGPWLKICVGNPDTSGDDEGHLSFFPSRGAYSPASWLCGFTCAPDAAPSPMQRAQRLYDLHQKLVSQS